jgi:hypothetical protein
MWLTLIVTILLTVAVFGFVLEPIIRGRPDRTRPDSVAVPDGVDAVGPQSTATADQTVPGSDERAPAHPGARVTDVVQAENGS